MASNAGTTVIAVTDASVVTIDLTAPTLTLVRLVSSNANDDSLANSGDMLSLSLTASESIRLPSDSAGLAVKLAGQVASVTGEGVSYAATYTVDAVDVSGTVDLWWTLGHGLRLRTIEAMRFVAPRVVDSRWVK